MLTVTAETVSYPNGNYNADTLRVASELGFEYGVTVDKRKNYLPLREEDKLSLGRFVIWGKMPLKMQCDIFRSDMRKSARKKVSKGEML